MKTKKLIIGGGLAAAMALLAAIVVPSLVPARNLPNVNDCVENLRLIDAGKEQAALMFCLTYGDSLSTNSVNQYIRGKTTPVCPNGGKYRYGTIGSDPECDYEGHKSTGDHIAG